MLLDILAAIFNEGTCGEMLRRYLPKSSARDLDGIYDRFGAGIYREIIWDERAKESIKPPYRSSVAWPIKRPSMKVVPIRGRQK